MELKIFQVFATFWILELFAKSAVCGYTVSEKQSLKIFRNLMQPLLYRDFMTKDKYLIRWLRNDNMNLQEAKRKLSSALKFRKEHNVDAIPPEGNPEFKRFCKAAMDGRDKQGRPVFTSDFSTCKTRELILRGLGGAKYEQRAFQVFEKLNKLVSDAPENVTDAIGISDISGFSIREHACLACIPLQLLYHNVQDIHYPLIYHRFFMINVPKAFENMYQLMRETISEVAKQRHFVYGYNKEEWQPEILKLIAPDQLTTQFGGTKSVYANKKL